MRLIKQIKEKKGSIEKQIALLEILFAYFILIQQKIMQCENESK